MMVNVASKSTLVPKNYFLVAILKLTDEKSRILRRIRIRIR